MGSPQMNFLDATVEVNGDTASLKVAGNSIPLPPAKSKKLIEGGYAGKTVTFGIRPEDVYEDVYKRQVRKKPLHIFRDRRVLIDPVKILHVRNGAFP